MAWIGLASRGRFQIAAGQFRHYLQPPIALPGHRSPELLGWCFQYQSHIGARILSRACAALDFTRLFTARKKIVFYRQLVRFLLENTHDCFGFLFFFDYLRQPASYHSRGSGGAHAGYRRVLGPAVRRPECQRFRICSGHLLRIERVGIGLCRAGGWQCRGSGASGRRSLRGRRHHQCGPHPRPLL